MNRRERRALEALDLDGLVDALKALIGVRSDGGRESAAQEVMAGWMADFGLDTDVWEIDFPGLSRMPAYTVDIERDQGLGVVGTLGSGSGPTLIFNGHIDVVPAGDEARWSTPPWSGVEKNGRVHGRGAADMKGGLCCALFAAKAIADAGVELGGRIQLQSVIGEEDGGCGTLATIARGHRGDGAIIMEPTSLTLAPAQAGAHSFRISVPGLAAHGALRTEGADPIEAFIPIFRALQAFEAERNGAVDDPLFDPYEVPFALCIGKLRCGIWASTVAEELVCEGRLGIGPHEDAATVRRDFETCVARAADAHPWLTDHPPAVSWPGAQFDPARIPPDHPLVACVAGAFEAAEGRSCPVIGAPYGADMRLLVREAGIPTVIFGPGDIRAAHAPDESVDIDELRSAARTLILAALRFCG